MPKAADNPFVQRRYVFNGMDLQDPSHPDKTPQMTPTEVRDFHALNYSVLGNARVKGPTMDGDVEVYKLIENAGDKS